MRRKTTQGGRERRTETQSKLQLRNAEKLRVKKRPSLCPSHLCFCIISLLSVSIAHSLSLFDFQYIFPTPKHPLESDWEGRIRNEIKYGILINFLLCFFENKSSISDFSNSSFFFLLLLSKLWDLQQWPSWLIRTGKAQRFIHWKQVCPKTKQEIPFYSMWGEKSQQHFWIIIFSIITIIISFFSSFFQDNTWFNLYR